MDFLERLVLDAVGTKFMGTEAQSPVLGVKQTIAIAPSPSSVYDHYYDGSYRQQYAFRVLVKHENQLIAYQVLNDIAAMLTSVEDIPSANGTYIYEGMNITTDPNMIGQDEKYFIFGAQFAASLYIKSKGVREHVFPIKL